MGLFDRVMSSLSGGFSGTPNPRTDDLDNCPYCGAGLVGFGCVSCDVEFVYENDALIEAAISTRGPRQEQRCNSCDTPMTNGGEFVAAWEDGNNEDAYVECPHCGYQSAF